ncbi:hypothetical protein MMC25_001049 [Agyrium rufum]|nr:hypothetical protein [Agyrium rufum]
MYVNAQNTFTELLGMGVIPIVNENDTVAVSEIKFGDNDTLSAITAGMVHADYLFLMTDVDCLYDKNPRKFPEAVPIRVVEEIQQLEADVTSKGSALGTGGMSTKIDAARLGTAAGVTTIITSSSKPGNVAQIVKALQKQRLAAEADFAAMKLHASETSNQMHTPSYAVTKVQDHPDRPAGDAELDSQEPPTQPPITPHMKEMLTRQINNTDPADCPLHTCFLPEPNPIRSRDFWIQAGLKPHGTVYIDEGAHRALIDKAGLLPSGIIAIKGKFHQQEAVRIAVVKGTTNLEEFSHFVDDAEDKLAGLGTKHRSKISDGLATGNRSGARTPPTPPEVREVGRALVNYSAPQISRIKGLKSAEILGALGYSDSEYVAQRENISLFPDGKGATDGHME